MENSLHSSCGCANISLSLSCLLVSSRSLYLPSGADGLASLPSQMAISERDPAFPFSRHPQSLWESALEILSPGFGDEKASLTRTLLSAGWHPYFLGIPQLSQCFCIAWEVRRIVGNMCPPLVSLGQFAALFRGGYVTHLILRFGSLLPIRASECPPQHLLNFT